MKTKILFSFAVLMFLSNCQAPVRYYSETETIATPAKSSVPSLVKRGESYSFSVKTEAGAICHAGINFGDIDENWIHEELSVIEADDMGFCQWEWRVPVSAKDGMAGFRGYVEIGEQESNISPKTFCVEKCDFE